MEEERILRIAVPRELDHHSADRISREADRQIREGLIEELIFDFSGTVFCDSSGIGMLMGRYKLMQALGGTVRAAGVQDRVARIFMLSGVSKLIPMEERQGGEEDGTGSKK